MKKSGNIVGKKGRRRIAKVLSLLLTLVITLTLVVPSAVSADEGTAMKVSVRLTELGSVVETRALVGSFDEEEAVTLSGDIYVNEDTISAPILVGEEGLRLIIKDGVTLTIDATGLEGAAGIQCGPDSKLTITAGTDDGSDPQGTGKLIVKGGKNGAAIGGSASQEGSNITIDSCVIYAYGGEGAAAIGGGQGANGENITIIGGVIYAYGGKNAAGIGGGARTNGDSFENICIYGGTVYAYGGEGGAGIGTGLDGEACEIYIFEGIQDVTTYVEAEGGANAAGIGNGNSDLIRKDAHDIYIYSGTVKAKGGAGGAGIGGGNGTAGHCMILSGDNITAEAGDQAAAIGGGANAAGYDIRIYGGTITAKSEGAGAGIGGGINGSGYDIWIEGGTVTASSLDGAGIGSGANADSEGEIIIYDGVVTAVSTGSGAGIGSGKDGAASGEIYIYGGTVTATGGGTGNSMVKKNGTGCAIGCGARNSDASINAVYVSTTLAAKFSYNDGGTYTQSITPYDGNWATDNSHNENSSTWRDVKIQAPEEASASIVIGTQNSIPVYGTEESSTYDLTASNISGGYWDIEWYRSGEAVDEGPAEFYVLNGKAHFNYDGQADAGEYTFKLFCDGVSSNEAVYTVNKCPATITSGSAKKVYDGAPLTCESCETAGFLSGEGVDVVCTGSCTGTATQTEPTVANNTFSYTAKAGTNLDNYEITEVEGTLTVVNQLFVVTAENYSGIYDGKEHEFSAKVVGKNGIDYTAKATFKYSTSKDGEIWSEWTDVKPGIKNAGTLYVKAIVSATFNGQTATLASDVYTMTVVPRSLVLVSGSKWKEYDGTSLENIAVTWTGGDGFVSGEGFASGKEPRATGTIKKVGSVQNEISSYTFADGTSKDNYEVIEEWGTLTVTPKEAPITITTLSNSKTYDGDIIDAGTATYTAGVLASGDALKVTLLRTGDGAVKDAGRYKNSIASYQVVNNQTDEDVTKCYTFAEPEIGTLTIEKRKLTLTSGNDLKIKTQEGDYAYNDKVTESGDGLVQGESLAYSGFKTVTEVSYRPTENTFEYAKADSSEFNENNYDITVKYGYLMLVEEMSILGKDQTFTYDGTQHKAPVTLIDNGQGAPVKVTYSTSRDQKSWTPYTETVPTIQNAGVIYVRVKAKKGVQEKDASYKMTVVPRNVILSTDSLSKCYDGTALTAAPNAYTISGEGFVNGEGINVTLTGTQTDVGHSDNTVSYTFKEGTEEDNYIIAEDLGTLTVDPNETPILINSGSDTHVYDGKPFTCKEYVVIWDGKDITENAKLFGEDVLEVTPVGTITDVGYARNEISYRIVRNGVDVTSFYTIELEEGLLTVEQRSIVITTGSAEKVYDGTALTNAKYTITGDGFLAGDGFETVKVVGTRTNAGTTENVLDAATPYTFKEGTEKENYNIIVKPGTLKVNKRKVTVTSGSAVSTYGACPRGGLSNQSDCTVTGDGFVSGEVESVKGSTVLPKPNSEPSPSASVIADNVIEYRWTGNGNPANYEITELLGTLMIVNESVNTVATTDYVGVYDGESHTGSFASTITDPNKIEYSIGDEGNWTTTCPEFTDVTDTPVTVKVKITGQGGSSATASFKVTITKRTLTLTAGSAEKTYDGFPLTCSDYTIGGDGFANDTEKTDANVRTEADETVINATSIPVKNRIKYNQNKSGSFNPGNYDISLINGTLQVNRRSLVLISGSLGLDPDDPLIYDGETKTCKKVTVAGDCFAGDEDIDFDDFTEACDAGTYLNLFSEEVKGSTDLGNYEIKRVYGVINISPRSVTLASANDQKMYNGKALTNDEITVGGDGFAKNEGAVFEVTGSQTSVGMSDNTFTYTLKKGVKETNYEIFCMEGVLEVYDSDTLRIVVPDNKEYSYDSKAHGEAAKAYIGDTPCTDTIWYSVDGGKTYTDKAPQITEVGTVEVHAYVEKADHRIAEGTYTITVKKSNNIIPKTGDSTLWYLLINMVAVAAIAVTLTLKRRYQR